MIKLTTKFAKARKTGKLFLSNSGLTSLPDVMFDIRNGLLDKFGSIDEANELRNHEKPWQCYGEETITIVDLSGNDLVNVESFDKFTSYQALRSLNLSNCNISSFPWSILKTDLVSLREINAPGNKFAEVPLHLMPESITTLNLAENCIEGLGDDMNTIFMPNLIKLDLQKNELISLPSKLSTPRLQYVHLSKNRIEIIPKDFLLSCKESLRTLDLSENQLSLPMNLVEHSQLEILELTSNKIAVPPMINENLVHLGLARNKLTSINGIYPVLEHCSELGRKDDGDWFRPKLKILHLRWNKLTQLHSQTMAVMTELCFLDLTDNNLETIPPVVGYLKDMNKIILDGNPLRVIRSAISYRPQGGIDTEKLLKSLRMKTSPPKGPSYHPDAGIFEETPIEHANTSQTMTEAKKLVRQATEGKRELMISGRGLTGNLHLPELIECLSVQQDEDTVGNNVSTLNISNGKLTCFGTEWVDALPSLSAIDAQRNCLNSLPANLSKLPLQDLNCSRNFISSQVLEDAICVHGSNLCNNLVYLDLSNNNLEWIPDKIFDLNKLKTLNLSKNSIKSLEWERDEDTGNERGWRHGLVSLEYLNLSDNRISKLGYMPLALFGCKNLHTLLLNNNCINNIPLEIGLLEQIKKIDLLGNSQRQIGFRVFTQSCSKILKYLRERMDENQIAQARSNHMEIIEALKEEYNVDIVGDRSINFTASVNIQKENTSCSPKQLEFKHIVVDTNKQEDVSSHKQQVLKQVVIETDNKVLQENKSLKVEQNEENSTINDLKEEIEKIRGELESFSLTQAKTYALKKSLAMAKSKLIREERRQKQNC